MLSLKPLSLTPLFPSVSPFLPPSLDSCVSVNFHLFNGDHLLIHSSSTVICMVHFVIRSSLSTESPSLEISPES